MNKKHVFLDLIFTFILSLIVLIVSFSTTFVVTNQEAKMNLKTYGDAISLIYDDQEKGEIVEEKFGSIIDIRITILKYSDGTPVLDINPNDNILSNENRYNELKNHLNSYYEKKSLTTGYDTLYYVTKNNDYFIRVGLPISEIRDVSFNVLIYGTIGLILVNILYGMIKIYIYKKEITSLKRNINSLESVVSVPSLSSKDDGVQIINDTLSKIKIDFQNKINELNIQKNQNDFILDSIEEGFIVLDENKNISVVNRYAIDILDLHKDEILGKNFVFLALGNDVNNKLYNFNENGYSSFDLTLNGRIFLFIITKIGEDYTSSHHKTSIVITFFDVTELRLNDKMKREFFQNASHELKTPLTTVIAYEGMINNNLLDNPKEIANANEVILKEAQRMKSVIDDMLTLSQIESGAQISEITTIDAKSLVLYVIDSLAVLAKEKNIKIKTNLRECELVMEQMDFDRLVRNLISNSIKYNKANGSIKVTLTENYLRVEDTGIGIKEEDIPRIFERFYRVDKGRSREQGGTGLGLAIVKHISLKYNFKISIQSKLGVGTKFIVLFKNE